MTDDELVAVLTPPFSRLARRLSRVAIGDDAQDADDLLQEGLIGALKARRRWRADGGRSERDFCFYRGYGAMRDAKRRGASALYFHRHCEHFSARIATVVRLSRLPAECRDVLAEKEPATAGGSRAEFVRAARRLFRGTDARAVDVAVGQHADGMTTDQIAAEMGLSPSRFFSIFVAASERVRERYERHEAAELLGLS